MFNFLLNTPRLVSPTAATSLDTFRTLSLRSAFFGTVVSYRTQPSHDQPPEPTSSGLEDFSPSPGSTSSESEDYWAAAAECITRWFDDHPASDPAQPLPPNAPEEDLKNEPLHLRPVVSGPASPTLPLASCARLCRSSIRGLDLSCPQGVRADSCGDPEKIQAVSLERTRKVAKDLCKVHLDHVGAGRQGMESEDCR